MKLDSRIIKGKRPLDCVDVDIAKTYIGQKGYFANCLCAFQNLKSIDYHLTYATLKEVNSQRTMAFADDFNDDEFSYFLPEEWVQEKEPEPVWKPYDLDTLREDKILLGNTITFRRKTEDNSARVITAIYNGKSENSDDLNDSEIVLGCEWFGFQRLFEDYEIFDNVYGSSNVCKWRPFGYQE